MENQQIEEIFSDYGYDHLYQHIKFPIEISGILANVPTEHLEAFLDAFDYSEYDKLLFDEFRYYFTIFHKSIASNH